MSLLSNSASSAAGRRRLGRQAGFTLLEIVVALVLVGFGLAIAFTAISGAQRLSRRAAELEAAMVLARAKLDEVSLSADYDVADDGREERYGGTVYSYKIEIRPVDLVPEPLRGRMLLPFTLDEVQITVYWGEGRAARYTLSRYRQSRAESAGQAAGPPAAAKPPSGPGAAAPGTKK